LILSAKHRTLAGSNKTGGRHGQDDQGGRGAKWFCTGRRFDQGLAGEGVIAGSLNGSIHTIEKSAFEDLHYVDQ
jgi:hypothetical protein